MPSITSIPISEQATAGDDGGIGSSDRGDGDGASSSGGRGTTTTTTGCTPARKRAYIYDGILCLIILVVAAVLIVVFLWVRSNDDSGTTPQRNTNNTTMNPNTNVPTVTPARVPTVIPVSTNAPVTTRIITTYTETSILTIIQEEEEEEIDAIGFGSSVALGGTYAAIGAPLETTRNGTVYMYQQQQESVDQDWTLAQTISNDDDIAEFGQFGFSVDIENRYMVIGAPYSPRSLEEEESFGAAYLYYYELVTGMWQRLGPPLVGNRQDIGVDEEFGYSVAVSDGTTTTSVRVVVGGPGSNAGTFANPILQLGSVYIYEYDNNGGGSGSWRLLSWIQGSTANARFGTAVDISKDGSVVMVGAPGLKDGQVSVFVNDNNDSNSDEWLESILPGVSNEEFGTSVSILSDDGSIVAAGGPNYDTNRGRIVVYSRRNNGTYRILGEPLVGTEAGDRLGSLNSFVGTNNNNNNPSITFATGLGVVRSYEYVVDTEMWMESSMPLESGFSNAVVAVAVAAAASGSAQSVLLVGGNSESAKIYDSDA